MCSACMRMRYMSFFHMLSKLYMFSHVLALASIPFVFEASDLYRKLAIMLLVIFYRVLSTGGKAAWGTCVLRV